MEQVLDHHMLEFPLEIGLVKDGKMTVETVELNKHAGNFEIKSKERPDSIVLDPNQWALFEEVQTLNIHQFKMGDGTLVVEIFPKKG